MDFGLINLSKPSGISSHGALKPIERALRPAKVGHAGTLDPLASGVLVVLIGPATRLADRVHAWTKEYCATFQLGRHSETEDIEGQVTEMPDAPQPTRIELQSAAERMTGVIWQQPPAFSALKVHGQRAYALAREGVPVELAPRQITVQELEIMHYDYPDLQLHIVCSTGTYVRSLGRDVARAVGTEAVMSALVRTRVGPMHVTCAIPWDTIRAHDPRTFLLPAREAVPDLPALTLAPDQLRRVLRGQTIELDGESPVHNQWAALTIDGQLAAILQRQPDASLRAVQNFLPQLDCS